MTEIEHRINIMSKLYKVIDLQKILEDIYSGHHK